MNYKKIGLKAGIEIHQQTEGRKLFCDCPTVLREDNPQFILTRRLKSSAGETGEIDVAAAQEQAKNLYYIYEGHYDSSCLVECDSEPPHAMNNEAFDTVLQVALILKARIIDKIQVMRKTVVDGSNTSGFQRTSLVAIDGRLETSEGAVTIPSICIEEDAARKIEQTKNSITYRLDRLGIPLIEIATGPELKSPNQVKEAAEKLGMILRSTNKVKRGLGTIRQDVNISIKGGERIEIKGAQDLRMLPKLVEYECLRQSNLLKIKELLPKDLKIDEKELDVSDIFKNTESKVIKNTLLKNGFVLVVKLPGFEGILGRELQPGRRLGTELSDRAKIIAGVGGLFHSDELPNYGINEDEVKQIRKILSCRKEDAFVLVADQLKKTEEAMRVVIDRAKECLIGVPKEVRKANDNWTTSYLRPIPGAARMYPETDVKNIGVTKDKLKSIKIPELLTDKSSRYMEKLNLGKDLANLVTKSGKHDLFERFTQRFQNIKPAYIAEIISTAPKQIKKQFNTDTEPTDQDYEDIFIYLNAGKISKESVLNILKDCNKRPIQDIIVEYELMPDKDLKDEIKKITNENKNLPLNALIGKVMGELRGKAEGKKIVELVKKHVKYETC